MDKISGKLRVVLLLSQNIYSQILSQHLFKSQDDNFAIIGVVKQYFPKKENKQRSLTFKDKFREILQKKGIRKGVFYLIFQRFFISPNSRIKKILRKFLTNKWIEYSTVIEELVKDFSSPLLVTDDINDERARKFLEDLKPDLGVVCGSGIIKDYIFTIPKFGCINYHAGIVPKYRGCEPIFWQLYYKDDVGYTVHKIDKEVDTGEIILKKVIPYKKTNNLWETMVNIKKEMSKDCAKEIVKIILKLKQIGQIESYPQDNQGANFFKHPNSEQKKELEVRFLNYVI